MGNIELQELLEERKLLLKRQQEIDEQLEVYRSVNQLAGRFFKFKTESGSDDDYMNGYYTNVYFVSNIIDNGFNVVLWVESGKDYSTFIHSGNNWTKEFFDTMCEEISSQEFLEHQAKALRTLNELMDITCHVCGASVIE